MMMFKKQVGLIEYVPVELEPDSLSPALAEHLWRNYKNQLSIDFPTPLTNHKWRLINNGWAGYIPVKYNSEDILIVLEPRVQLENIFRLLEYAYNLESVRFLRKHQIQCDTLQDFFNILAGILARRVLNRARKGLYKAYCDEDDKLSYVRGRIDMHQQLKTPFDAKLSCHYQDCTPDVSDNQILLWTLYLIVRSRFCSEETLQVVRKAFRVLQKVVSLAPFTARQCSGRFYNRLNLDYQPMQNLCRFFLEHTGPQLARGKQAMIPFMINMPRLYELFVAQWLKVHLPGQYEIKAQEKVHIGESNMLHFNIDLVIYEKEEGKALYVLDTKYKLDKSTSPADFAQVVTYALSKGSPEAVLIYPGDVSGCFNGFINTIRVRSLDFKIDGDIEEAGSVFLDQLLEQH